MKTFDAIVIGSGQGGTPLSKKLAKAGLKTAIIERRFVGGTCINDGCTPTKAMIASAKLAYEISRSSELGVISRGYSVDLRKVVDRKNQIVESFRGSAEKGLEETTNLSLIFGEAQFTGTKTISVKLLNGDVDELEAKQFFINTGTTPDIPEIPGLETVPYHTSTSLLDVTVIPKHLLIIGGGYISLEFAQMYRRFGSAVTIISRDAMLMSHEDADVSTAVCDFLEKEGISIYKSAVTKQVIAEGQEIVLEIQVGGKPLRVQGTDLLIATGRNPSTGALHLEKAGVEVDDAGHIKVNEFLETTADGIYAIGDVKGGPAFTHISYNDHLVVLKQVLENNRVSIKDRPVPYTVFTDPQLGRIGLSEKEARAQGLNILVAKMEMDRVARAIETGQTTGFMKAVVDADSKQILGAAILGPEGGEVMTILQMAMTGKITYDVIREYIFAHPLYAESLNNLFIPLDK